MPYNPCKPVLVQGTGEKLAHPEKDMVVYMKLKDQFECPERVARIFQPFGRVYF